MSLPPVSLTSSRCYFPARVREIALPHLGILIILRQEDMAQNASLSLRRTVRVMTVPAR